MYLEGAHNLFRNMAIAKYLQMIKKNNKNKKNYPVLRVI